MNDLHTPQISLFSEHEEPQSYEVYVYGTDDLNEQNKDSFCVALCRYLDEIHISQKTLARLTGIAPSTLSRYLSGKAEAQGVYHLARKRIKKYVQNANFFFLEKETWEKPSRFCKILG